MKQPWLVPPRALFTMGVTVIALFFLFNFKTPDQMARSNSNNVVIPSTPATPAPQTANAAASNTPPPTPTAASGYKDGTFTGQDFPNEFGDVQVALVISGGRITDVRTVQMPNDRPRSAYISQQVTPWLHDEVLQAQSAQIDLISGATFTSDSYAQSVQSALDQAK